MIPVVVIALALALAIAIAIAVVRRRRTRRTVSSPPTMEPHIADARFGVRLGSLGRRGPDAEYWDELETRLIAADAGVPTATRVVADVKATRPSSPSEVMNGLRSALLACFGTDQRSIRTDGAPGVIVVVGVNGSGKTTTIAKVADMLIRSGSSVLVAAADTYRAAAADQIELWGERIGFATVRGSDGADPAAVAFDGFSAAQARGIDVLIVDTAGRLHSNKNLMDELAKVVRVLERGAGSIGEILLVIDGSAGQNSLVQARAFADSVGVTGVAVTKLDGSSRGGVVLAIEHELGLPLKLIGTGEQPGDLLHFDPEAFVDELLRDE